eukprot:1311233-Amphidinium_carterae.1
MPCFAAFWGTHRLPDALLYSVLGISRLPNACVWDLKPTRDVPPKGACTRNCHSVIPPTQEPLCQLQLKGNLAYRFRYREAILQPTLEVTETAAQAMHVVSCPEE